MKILTKIKNWFVNLFCSKKMVVVGAKGIGYSYHLWYFTPDQELLDFANDFSSNWNLLPVGDHFSINKKYHIKYLWMIYDTYDTGRVPNTNIRVGHETGIIEISKSRLMELETNPDYLFFQILWCIVQKDLNDIPKSDIVTMEYYLTTGRSVKNVIIGYISLFSTALSEDNNERIAALIKFTTKNGK